MKKSKLSTPAWVLEGYNSKEEYEKKKGIKKEKKKGKNYFIKICPECRSNDVKVILTGEEGRGEWECYKCKWKGKDIEEKEVSEDEFLKYLDEKGEEVA